MSFFGKVFKFHNSENHDDFLDSLGLPSDRLGIFSNFKSNQKIEKSGDKYIYTLSTPVGEKPLTFTSGVEFEDLARDIPVKNTLAVNGNQVTHVMKFDTGLVVTAKKEFSGTKMVEEITNNNWDGVATVTYYA